MPHRKLAASRLRVRDEQRRQIDADNQQHEQDGPGDQDQRVALRADDILVQRSHHGEMALRVVIGKPLRPVRAERLQLRVGLREGDAVAKSCDGNERMAPAVVRRFRRIDWQRDPRTHSIVAERKVVGHDADHFTRLIIEPDRRADCAEGPL